MMVKQAYNMTWRYESVFILLGLQSYIHRNVIDKSKFIVKMATS